MKHLFTAISFCLLFFSLSAQVRSYGKAPGGVRFQLDKGLMEIDILAADVVRVRYTILDAFPPKLVAGGDGCLAGAEDLPCASRGRRSS